MSKGQRVSVSFCNRSAVGYVVGFRDRSVYKKLKSIDALLDNTAVFNHKIFRWTKIFARHYGCSWGEALETTLPSLLRKKRVLELPCPQRREEITADKRGLVLCHDKDGSQRWPFIIRKIEEALSEKKDVVFLVPEKVLIQEAQEFLNKNFDVPIAVIDKQLTPKREMEQWALIRSGEKRIVLGTRSAVFAPVMNLGLMIVCDEENMAYKQEQSPFYHVRDVAQMRLESEGGTLLFVSSAPSAEVWWTVKKQKGVLATLEGDRRGDLQFIDMTNYKPQKNSSISYPLRNNIQETLSQGGKVVLFLNRRGFSTMTRCNQCGYILKCHRCDATLAYLHSRKKLVCHLCNTALELPRICPGCNGSYLRSMGTGIEKIESELARIFPQAVIDKFDKETERVPRGANIIVATQAVLKILRPLSIDLIGVLDFDAELNRFDFRSAQKAFSLLINLRKMAKGKVLIQTYQRENYCLQAALKMDFEKFYREEIKLRKELGFPPFKHLVEVCFRGTKEAVVFDQAKEFFEKIQDKNGEKLDVLEPQPDVLPKLRDQYRFIIMLKGKSVERMLKRIKMAMKAMKRKQNVIVTVNVDP